MKNSTRLKPVQRFVEMKETQAAKALGEFIKKMDQQKKRLADLNAYRDEYHRRFQESAQQGIPVGRLHDFRSFMANLEKAIEQQTLLMRQIEVDYEAKKRQWLAAHQRTQVIDNVVANHVTHEDHVEEKKQQRDMDDKAGRKAS